MLAASAKLSLLISYKNIKASSCPESHFLSAKIAKLVLLSVVKELVLFIER